MILNADPYANADIYAQDYGNLYVPLPGISPAVSDNSGTYDVGGATLPPDTSNAALLDDSDEWDSYPITGHDLYGNSTGSPQNTEEGWEEGEYDYYNDQISLPSSVSIPTLSDYGTVIDSDGGDSQDYSWANIGQPADYSDAPGSDGDSSYAWYSPDLIDSSSPYAFATDEVGNAFADAEAPRVVVRRPVLVPAPQRMAVPAPAPQVTQPVVSQGPSLAANAAAEIAASQVSGDFGYSTHTGFDPGTGTVHAGVSNNYSSGGSLVPVVLDLTGKGIHITPESSSNIFMKIGDDSEQHLTAWAGAGNGVLVLDSNGNGVIDQKDQVDFTSWDPTAQTDMQALRDVFDTNHNGMLDAGDADWSKFKVMVTNADGTTTLQTLAALGITSINLTTNNQVVVMSDGSSISGETSYTKTVGTTTSTGTAADASFAYDTNGYVTSGTTTHNADGSTTIDNKVVNTDGSLASEIISTVNAAGTTTTLKFDDDGDGVIDRQQTDTSVANTDGSVTQTIANHNGAGTLLTNNQVTTTSADGKTITISIDTTGSGHFDQTETEVIGTGGLQTVTAIDLSRSGTTLDKTITSTSSDGLTKTVQYEATGSGVINTTETDNITVSSGVRTETVKSYAGTGTLAANLVSSVVTVTSADDSTGTVTSDLDGNGTTDLITANSIVHNGDGSTTITQTDSNGNSSLRDKTVKLTSADGNTTTTQTDADGNGTYDLTTTDTLVLGVGGSKTETVIDKSASAVELDETVTTWSADGKTRTIDVDSDGDGHFDQIETVALVSGSSVDTVSNYSPNGAALESKTVTTTSADGLTSTQQIDANGDGVYDSVVSSTTVHNGNGSSTVTTTSSAGTTQIGKTAVTTSADGLTTTSLAYLDAATSPDQRIIDVKVINADDSTTDTATNYSGTDLAEPGRTMTTVSADKLTATVNTYVDTYSHPDSVSITALNSDGSRRAPCQSQRRTGWKPCRCRRSFDCSTARFGTHAELLAKPAGLYARLWALQNDQAHA